MRKAYLYILGILFMDQLTKYLVVARFEPGETLSLLPFFQLSYVTNTGVSFGMFSTVRSANTFFIIFTVIVLTAAFFWYRKNKAHLTTLAHPALLLVASGALGNLIDRVFRGSVVDFLDVYAGTYHWPAFNVADSCISVGGILLAFSLLTEKETA